MNKNEQNCHEGFVKLFGRRYSYKQQNRHFSIKGLSERFCYKNPLPLSKGNEAKGAKLEFSIGFNKNDLTLNVHLLSGPKEEECYDSATWLGRLSVENPIFGGKTGPARIIFETSLNMYGNVLRPPFLPCLEVLSSTELVLNHPDLTKYLPRLLTWCFRHNPTKISLIDSPGLTSFSLSPKGWGYIPKESSLKDIMFYLTSLDRLPNETEAQELRKRIETRSKNDLDRS